MNERRLPGWMRTALPWVITAGILALIFWKIDIHKTLGYFKVANLLFFLPVVTGFYVYVFFVNTLAYYKVLRWHCSPISYWNILSIRGASYLLTSVNAGAGQGGLLLWVARKQNLKVKDVLSSFLLLPVVDILFLAVALSLPLMLNLFGGRLLPPATVSLLLWIVLALWALVIAHMAFWLGDWRGKIADRLRRVSWMRAYGETGSRQYAVLFGIRCLQHVPGILAFYAGLWAFKGFVAFPVFLVRFFPALLIQALPVTVAQMGTAQGGWIMMFGSLVDENILVAFTLSWNFVYFMTRVVIGAVFFRGEAREYFTQKAVEEERASLK